ncbi:MAG: methyltransferase domain-containing protein [Chitinivibrionales bacterium]|nr:methyltransferase domain-containing protein [Chitinivibrionales bacterium]MBD3395715.1 methyltransferase domain-containing protein [Chitinivibrionales bacterium]
MASDSTARAFSEGRHRDGTWHTRVSDSASPFRRIPWNLISLKRLGVDTLARNTRAESCGLDLGCGNGAYAHWFAGRTPATIVAADWSLLALQNSRPARRGSILRVCCDARALPFPEGRFDFAYTVDALGHIPGSDAALDELSRVVKPGSALFVHSECRDHEKRWPDRRLIERLGKDSMIRHDGHIGVRWSAELYQALRRRFLVESFISPAGVLAWLIGYPEKYHSLFKEAGWRLPAMVTGVLAFLKAAPVLGAVLRFANAVSNRIELFFGLVGGGSCFAFIRKPVPTGGDRDAPAGRVPSTSREQPAGTRHP